MKRNYWNIYPVSGRHSRYCVHGVARSAPQYQYGFHWQKAKDNVAPVDPSQSLNYIPSLGCTPNLSWPFWWCFVLLYIPHCGQCNKRCEIDSTRNAHHHAGISLDLWLLRQLFSQCTIFVTHSTQRFTSVVYRYKYTYEAKSHEWSCSDSFIATVYRNIPVQYMETLNRCYGDYSSQYCFQREARLTLQKERGVGSFLLLGNLLIYMWWNLFWLGCHTMLKSGRNHCMPACLPPAWSFLRHCRLFMLLWFFMTFLVWM
jgi:hypothetical protein